MTHFNHDWDNQNPAVPVSVGDRFYAQDLNDDFNYLKHLPYETLFQKKSRGVLIAPQDTLDSINHILTLQGGICACKTNTIVLDTDETFVIPPKTKSEPRFERVALLDSVIVLPQDDTVRYLTATPNKRSLLQRTKALLIEQWYCRTKYDSVIAIQDTAPTSDQILIGLVRNDEYLLLIDNKIDQCEKAIYISCWKGIDRISESMINPLKTYYDTNIDTVTGEISISDLSSLVGTFDNGKFDNCKINGLINGGTFDHCLITGKILSGVFNYCKISAEINGNNDMDDTIFNYCEVTNVLDTANYSANNSFITYPNPQSPIALIRASNCIINIEEAITDRAFYSFKDCILTNVEVHSKNDAPAISSVDTYFSSFVTWFKNSDAPQQLCSGIAQQAEGIMPTGSIIAFGGDVIPYGWWICDGAEKSRSEYNKLFSRISTSWGVGDGVSTFNIPDLRESALVGVGQSSKTSRHDIFTLGEFKDDQFQNHKHSATTQLTRAVVVSQGGTYAYLDLNYASGKANQPTTSNLGVTTTVNDPNTGNHGDITRGKRSGVNYLIRWL